MSTAIITIARPKFSLGDTVITANAHALLDPTDIAQAISRHASGDWGELCPEDLEQNEHSLEAGGRLFSAYGSGERRFWVITECDHSVTTVLMPQDY